MASDPHMQDMPAAALKVGIPTGLARALIEKVVAGFADRVTIH